MPRGTSRYDEAKLQRQLWTPAAEQSRIYAWYDFGDRGTYNVNSFNEVVSIVSKAGGAAPNTQSTNPTYAVPYGATFFSTARFLPTFPASTFDFALVGTSESSGANRDMVVLGATTIAAYISSTGDQIRVADTTTEYTVGTLTWPGATLGQIYVNLTGASSVNIARDGSDFQSPVGETLTLTTTPALFGSPSGLTRPFGTVNEVIALSVNAPDPLRRKIEGYFAHRWDSLLGQSRLVSALVASHPFKNRPPLIGD